MGRTDRSIIRTVLAFACLTAAFGFESAVAEEIPRAVFAEKFGYAS